MMTRASWGMAVISLLTPAAFGQSGDSAAKFEVADVHPSPRALNSHVSGPFLNAGRYELRKATMLDLLHIAYGLDNDKIFGGPDWLEMDRFDVIAKSPEGSTAETRKLMLQSLLAERFHAAVHGDTKPLPAYALTTGKHQGLKPADPAGEPGCKVVPQAAPVRPIAGDGPILMVPTANYNCRNMTMAAFVNALPKLRFVPFILENRPVSDHTGLEGSWDFNLQYSPPARMGAATSSAETTSLFDDLDKHLGLKLDAIKVSMPVLIVDSVNRKPTENSPDIAKSLPSPPAEFEVAEIKPAEPRQPGTTVFIAVGGRIMGDTSIENGRVTLKRYTLKSLISMAWEIDFDDALAGLPKFAESDRYDVIAKVPGAGPSSPNNFDLDPILPMLRTLLIDRFKLTFHTEERPITGFILTAARPKLQKADPANRAKCGEGPGADGKDPRSTNPALTRLLHCENITMAQFAELLPSRAGGYVHTPVQDATGLEGAFDFTLAFSTAGMLNRPGGMVVIRGGDGGGASAPGASDPSGGLSLFDALTKQLGLKLEEQKRPMQVLVFDHVEPKPIDH